MAKADISLHEMMIEELRDIHNAERQLTRALPRLARATANAKLKQAFEHHLEETQGQIERLDDVFEELDVPSSKRGKKCEAMEGLVSEAREIIDKGLPAEVLDAALIGAAQKAEHYEIASYGTVCAWAKAMGHDKVLKLLHENLEEERATDEKLTSLAAEVNKAALQSAQRQSRAAE